MTVRTLCGTGEAGSGPGQIAEPFGLIVGPDGALYFCDIGNHRICRYDFEQGGFAAFVGNGDKGNSGDGGPALEAACNEPYEIRFDSGGNLYFVDMPEHVIRCVDAETGRIRTIAGTGEQGFAGDGGDPTAAQFSQPHSIEFDAAGNLYVADIGNHRVRCIAAGGREITTVAGTGEQAATEEGPITGAALNGPRAIAFDEEDKMILALREGNRILRLDFAADTIAVVGGTGKFGYAGDDGPARDARLAGPKGIALTESGGIVLADTESHTIRHIDALGIITTLLGTGENHDGPDGDPFACGLARPHGVYAHLGQLFIGDSDNHRVRVLDI